MERNRLKNILFILSLILILLVGSWFAYKQIMDRRDAMADIEKVMDVDEFLAQATEQETPEQEELPEDIEESEVSTPPEMTEEEAEAEEPVMEEPVPAEATKIERFKTGEHTVQEGESFSLITGFYWEDIFLWPDLYIRNSMRTEDPDLIYPDEIIDIYNRLGVGDEFTGRETEEILEAYLQVYRIYKKLGDRKNNSVWSLLWCAARYDHDFLEKYGHRIDPEDKAMAQKYIDEQGFLD